MERFKFWFLNGSLSIVFSLLLVGGGWAWTSNTNRIDSLEKVQKEALIARGERIAKLETDVAVLKQNHIEVKEYLIRIENKIDKVDNERTGRGKRVNGTERSSTQ